MTTQTKPNDVITGFNGLTKREYFAAMAMQAIANWDGLSVGDIVESSCYLSDKLIEELNKSR